MECKRVCVYACVRVCAYVCVRVCVYAFVLVSVCCERVGPGRELAEIPAPKNLRVMAF